MRSHARRSLAALTALTLALSLVPAVAVSASPPPSAAVPARRAAATAPPDAVIVQFADRVAKAGHLRTLEAAGVETATSEQHADGRVLVRVRPGEDVYAVARGLGERPGVRWAVPDIAMHAAALPVPPNDTYYYSALGNTSAQRSYLGPLATNPYSIDLEPAWQQAFASTDHGLDLSRPAVTLALVDTGYTATRETSGGVFVSGYNFVANSTNTADDEGHGTMVGNVMHAQTGNGLGIAGVQYATPSKVLVYKVLDSTGSGSMDDVVSGVKAAADAGAKVINCSLGGSAYDSKGIEITGMRQAWDDTLAYVTARGAVLVAAAGNENGAVDYPAAAAGAVAVGAIDPATGVRSSFSNHGPELALVAPGEHVLVYAKDGSTQSGAGTSFSSPIVAGSLGMLWSLLPKASGASMTSAILATSRDLGPTGVDGEYGHGELDVWAAYRALMDTFPTQAALSVSVTGTAGFTRTLQWSAAQGSDVVYHYGVVGGPSYTTTHTSGDVYVGADGAYTGWVSASASDMFSGPPATLGFTVSTGHPALLMQRYAGTDRYATAAAVSRSTFPTSAAGVIVASGENFPDALSASVLAYRSGAPLLLTRRASLPKDTADEIARLKPASVVIVGGTASVSADVRAALAGLTPSVTRIAGADRYETAEKVAVAVRDLEGSVPSATVVIASGENFPDALAASPMAAAAGYPILLTRHDRTPAATTRALGELGAARTILVGGTATVTDAAASALPSVTRIAGRDRYETSRMVADAAVSAGILSRRDLGVATGRGFPDALAGGVAMARLGGPLVLGDGATTPMDVWLAGIGDSCTGVAVFGSSAAVPDAFASHVLAKLRGL